MANKQAISSVSVSNTFQASHVAYYATFSGTSFTARLEINISGDWIPVIADISASMTVAVLIGRSDSSGAPLLWRWNVTAITAGTLTTYMG